MALVEPVEAWAFQDLALNSLHGFDLSLRPHHDEDLLDRRTRPQNLFQDDLPQEACASSDQYGLVMVKLLYVQSRLIHFYCY